MCVWIVSNWPGVCRWLQAIRQIINNGALSPYRFPVALVSDLSIRKKNSVHRDRRVAPPEIVTGSVRHSETVVQGDTSGCSLGFVDIKTKVEFLITLLILKLNFCFDVN